MAATRPDPRTAEILEYLGRGGNWQYLYFLPAKTARWFPAGADLFVPQVAQNVYFGVHPTAKQKRSNERGRTEDVCALNALFGDFDHASLDDLNDLLPRPSVCISSGGEGCYHAYWLLDQPAAVTDENRARLASIQKGWVSYIGADAGASDLARVLRLPGTKNYKYDPPRPVEFLWCDFSAIFSLDELSARLPPPEPARTAPGVRACDAPVLDDPDYWMRRALEQARRTNERNSSGFWLACQLRDAGIDYSQAESVMMRYQQAVTSWKPDPYTVKEALASLAVAYEKTAREPAKKKLRLPVSI